MKIMRKTIFFSNKKNSVTFLLKFIRYQLIFIICSQKNIFGFMISIPEPVYLWEAAPPEDYEVSAIPAKDVYCNITDSL